MFLPFSGRCDYCGRDDQACQPCPTTDRVAIDNAKWLAREKALDDAIAELRGKGDFMGAAVVKKLKEKR